MTLTHTICPQCNKIQEGEIFFENDQIKLQIICPQHGKHVGLLFDDITFYEKVKKELKSNKKKLISHFDQDFICFEQPEAMITTIHINFTEKCNLKCKDCFAVCDPKKNEMVQEISINQILEKITIFDSKKQKPMVVIIGGEPTLRPDLPELISKLSQKGYNVRLSSNGILLTNEEYLKRLVDSGLKWLLLQFDGFEASTSLEFRGVDLIKEKMQVIKNAQKLRLKIHLIMMISKGINDKEIMKALQFAFDQDYIYAINFYPVSQTGRYDKSSTSVIECIKNMEEQSNGRISRADYIESKRIWQKLYKIFKKPIFRQQICTYPIFFFKYKNKIYPINRLFKLKTFFFHPILWISNILKSLKLSQWAENPNKNFLYCNIEKFYHSNALDLDEAYDCHNAFVTTKGYIPLCIFNALYRTRKCI